MGEFKTADAVAVGREIAGLLNKAEAARAFQVMLPLVGQRVPFAMLDRVARETCRVPLREQDLFLEMLARSGTLGSWPMIGTMLAEQLANDLAGALEREKTLIMIGDAWYAVDAVAERAMGRALVEHLDATLKHIESWRVHENRWVRRSIGVGVHVWAKRNKGMETAKAKQIFKFLEPLWSERELDAVKGIGWGLKTMGRYYPELMKPWLAVQGARSHRALMMSKARTYL